MIKHGKLIGRLLVIPLLILVLSGCGASSNNTSVGNKIQSSSTTTAVNGTSVTAETTNAAGAEKVNLYDLKLADDKLAIWFFSLPGNDHTGESILIQTPNGKTILVDSGTAEAGEQVIDYLHELGIKTIDHAIATHMHIDHIGGFARIFKQFEVKEVYTSTFTEYDTNPTYAFLAALSENKLDHKEAVSGMKIKVDEDVTIEFLYPFEDTIPEDLSNIVIDGTFINDSSVVFRMTYGKKSFLFPGDLTMMGDLKLTQKYGDELKSDFIKVPHHGSDDASSGQFIKAVGAEYSVMCIYALNSIEIYDRYKKYGNRPYVTSLDGTVLLLSDGKNIEFMTEKERKGMLK